MAEKDSEVTMSKLLEGIKLKALLLTPEERMRQAAIMIRIAYNEAEERKEELNKEGFIKSKQSHKFLPSLLKDIKDGVIMLNKEDDRENKDEEEDGEVKIYIELDESNPQNITFVIKKKMTAE